MRHQYKFGFDCIFLQFPGPTYGTGFKPEFQPVDIDSKAEAYGRGFNKLGAPEAKVRSPGE